MTFLSRPASCQKIRPFRLPDIRSPAPDGEFHRNLSVAAPLRNKAASQPVSPTGPHSNATDNPLQVQPPTRHYSELRILFGTLPCDCSLRRNITILPP